MRTLKKAIVPTILVLSLSILIQQQPGICMTAVEYPITMAGMIATVKDGFLPATISFSSNDFFDTDNYMPIFPNFFKGNLNIKAQKEGKTVYDETFSYTAYYNDDEWSLFMTTTGKATLMGTITFTQGIMVLQIAKEGITGKFASPQN